MSTTRSIVFLTAISFLCLTATIRAEAAEGEEGGIRGFWNRIRNRNRDKTVQERVDVQRKKLEDYTPETEAAKDATPVQPVDLGKVSEKAPAAPEAGSEEIPATGEKDAAGTDDTKPAKKPEPEGGRPPRDVMLETIKRRMRGFPEIEQILPQISKRGEDKDGNPEYVFVAPGGSLAYEFDDLGDETLFDVYQKVNQHATRLGTERIIRQLRQQEQVMRVQNLHKVIQQPALPPSAPPSAVHTGPPPQTFVPVARQTHTPPPPMPVKPPTPVQPPNTRR